MVTRKVTVTLEESQLEHIRQLVKSGAATSVSGFVQHAVTIAIEDEADWDEDIAEALDETGGPLTAEERAWAARMLGHQAE